MLEVRVITRLLFERQSQCKTQAAVARAVGMSVLELRLAERGRLIPTKKELSALAHVLRVSQPQTLLRPVVVHDLEESTR